MFKDRGFEVHVATDTDKPIKYCDKKIKLPIKRSPFKLSNIKAIRQLKKIVNTEKYDIIHCHTPMGGVVARLAAKKARKNGTRVIYTAHGFHFYKGAPLKNWLFFYPVEKRLSKFTDTLITINTEDFERAKKKFGKRCFDIQYVPGVGVDEKKFEKKLSAKEKSELRKSLGLKDNDKVLICVGRLDKNKNQGFLIKAIEKLDDNYHLLLVGPDEINGKYQELADKLAVAKRVHFLGYRDDIEKLLQISDIAVSASKREGLPVNLMEAAFLGIPIVATDCRGNRDVCKVCPNSYIIHTKEEFVDKLNTKLDSIKNNPKDFSLDNTMKLMDKIYKAERKVREGYPIDFVVLWVDGSDPNWLKKKQKYKPEINTQNESVRYRDWGTFKYWFRGVDKYAPWVNHVYLITDNQKPEWLNIDHPKLTVIDHKDIMDEKDLPTFNSQAIEMNLHKIPGLSEHFVYFNDDVFLVNNVKPKNFFRKGLPVEVANINAATGMEGDQLFAQTMFNDILLINRHFNKKEVLKKHLFKWVNLKYGSFNVRTFSQIIYPYFTGFKAHHITVPFLKSTFEKVWEEERDILEETSSHRFRDPKDVNQYVFIQWQLCENKFVPRSVRMGEHVKFRGNESLKRVSRAFESRTKKIVCINDNTQDSIGEHAVQEIRERLVEIFEKRLPEKSSYEK